MTHPLLKVGIKGKMIFHSDFFRDGVLVEARDRVMPYRVEAVRSADFVVVRLDADGGDLMESYGSGTKPPRPAKMYCDLPRNKKDGTERVEITPTGYVRTLIDEQPSMRRVETVRHEFQAA